MEQYKVLGLMSGTSLDGLDLAFCTFTYAAGWQFRIHCAETVPYPEPWAQRFRQAMQMTSAELTALDREYGHYLGQSCLDFIRKYGVEPELISSHGHTVFHQPGKGFTLQIGHGGSIAATTGIRTVSDFRSQDIALGGQGAPLVPIGDRLLFGAYPACMNLGGFANISLEREHRRIAWDIGAVNLVLNELARQLGQPFDAGGELARGGRLNEELLVQLEALSYYSLTPPKSLGREWVESELFPLLGQAENSTVDLLHTFTEHAALRLASACIDNAIASVMVTGGGAYNRFLIERFGFHAPGVNIMIPEDILVQYKEALIFAFLGVLRIRGEVNTLASVTGAVRDHCAGALWQN